MNITKDDVGMTVWHIIYGEGEIISCLNSEVVIRFKDGYEGWYKPNGKHSDKDLFPSLYWSKPEIIAPPKPKRKEKREIVLWGIPRDDGTVATYGNENFARLNGNLPVVKLTGEYEVEV
jgi:hypothetical protein